MRRRRRGTCCDLADGAAAESQIQRLRKQKSELIKQGADREAVKALETRITETMRRFHRAMEAFEARQPA